MKGGGFGTQAVHAGQDPDAATGAVIPPISLSTTFQQSAPGVHRGFEYSRSDNPTRRAFEQAVAALEGAKYALAYSSGSATTATVLAALVDKDEQVVSVNDVYGGTYRYFTKVAPRTMGVHVTFVDMGASLDPLKAAMDKGGQKVKLVWIETPTNPTLRLVDIKAVCDLVHKNYPQALVVVDNTFLSPYFQNPLALGADLVVHSVTKYINGHSDAVMGVAATSNESILTRLRFMQNSLGAVPSAFDCFLANRGLKTLHLRMERHAQNAMKCAQFLQSHAQVEQVIYPGLPSHPQHELAKRQQKGFGGMITVRLRGNLETSKRFLSACKVFALAESLGGVESLAELPCIMTHGSVSPEDRQALGITDTLVRLSVGIEEADDLISDLKQALEAAK